MPAQWRLRQTRAVNRNRTYEKVRFTVTAPTTSFDCSQFAGITALTFTSPQGNPRSEIHGSVTGLARRHAFEAGFVFVAECAEDWNGNHRNVQTGFGLYIFHPPLAQPMSRWSPNLQEGGHDAATVSAKDETTKNLTVGAACFAPDLGRKWRCSSRRRALFHSQTN
jgi:hypothetical protein